MAEFRQLIHHLGCPFRWGHVPSLPLWMDCQAIPRWSKVAAAAGVSSGPRFAPQAAASRGCVPAGAAVNSGAVSGVDGARGRQGIQESPPRPQPGAPRWLPLRDTGQIRGLSQSKHGAWMLRSQASSCPEAVSEGGCFWGHQGGQNSPPRLPPHVSRWPPLRELG